MASTTIDYSALDAFEPIELLRLPVTNRLVDLSHTLFSYRILTIFEFITKPPLTAIEP